MLISSILLLRNLIHHLEDNMTHAIQTWWKAKRYQKFLASGCWSNCTHDIKIHPDKNEGKAHKIIFGG